MRSTANYTCDLHTHTNCSDGQDSPRELIDRAAACGLEVVAITDHDVMPPGEVKTGLSRMSLREYGISKGVHVLPGIEISCDVLNEDVHIVGLGCDFHHPFFADLERKVQESKMESYRELARKLTECGYPMLWQEVLEQTGNAGHPEMIQKKQIFELMAQRGYASSWSEAKKMTQTDPRMEVLRWKPDPRDIISSLRDAGGIAILAHPFLIGDTVAYEGRQYSRGDYIRLLVEAGLDGIEACYTYNKTSYRGSLSGKEIEKRIWDEYGNVLPIISGGSDYHGDYKKGVFDPRELGECGITWEYFESNKKLMGLLNPNM